MRTLMLTLVLASFLGCGRSVMEPSSSVSLSLSAPNTVSSKDSIVLSLAVTNVTSRELAVPLYAPGDDAFDVVVTTETGEVVWRRFAGPAALPSGGMILAPHETRVLAVTWNVRDNNGRPLNPGRYRIIGVLRGQSGAMIGSEQIHEFTVVPDH